MVTGSWKVRAKCTPLLLRLADADRCRQPRRKYTPFSALAAIGDAAEGPKNEGNPALQESLVSMVRLQIDQEKVKESVEVERQKLQELADEASAVHPDGVCKSLTPWNMPFRRHALQFSSKPCKRSTRHAPNVPATAKCSMAAKCNMAAKRHIVYACPAGKGGGRQTVSADKGPLHTGVRQCNGMSPSLRLQQHSLTRYTVHGTSPECWFASPLAHLQLYISLAKVSKAVQGGTEQGRRLHVLRGLLLLLGKHDEAGR